MNSGILTIDDISSPLTPAFVDYLNQKGITPVMFAVGRCVERYYDEAVYALQHGMIVGNHSYDHPHFSELSVEAGIEEIEKCEAVLTRLYADAGVERKYKLFRFPFGDKGGPNKEQLQQYLKEQRFDKLSDVQLPYPWWRENGLDKDIDTYWSYDFEEYRVRPGSGFTMEDVFTKMHDPAPKYNASLFGEGQRHILLLHNYDETEELSPGYYHRMIDHLLENGFTFEQPVCL